MLVFDAHTAHEIVGIDGDAFGIGRLVGDRLVAHAPALPPITASSSKVISGMRHAERLAFRLDFVRNCFIHSIYKEGDHVDDEEEDDQYFDIFRHRHILIFSANAADAFLLCK